MVASIATTTNAPSDNQTYVRPLPYLVPRSIIQKAAHFSEAYWKLDSDSIVFKLLDSLCGDAGAGNNKKSLFISRLEACLDSTYFQDLDAFYFGVLGFPRHLSESYDYNPYSNALTTQQWIEVQLKDAKYRSRCLDLMAAFNHGTSPFGIRMGCKSVLGVDCDIFEIWKYLDANAYKSGLNLNGGTASTPSSVALNITGDLDIRADIRLVDYTSGSIQTLIGKWNVTGDQRSYRLYVSATGFLVFEWSSSGAVGTVLTKTSTIAIPVVDTNRISVRATIDVDNGAAGNTVTFYTSTSVSGTWTALGTAVTTAGVTSIFSGSANLIAGAQQGGAEPAVGIICAAQVRNGIAGTIVANPDFTSQPSGTTSFSDSVPITWTVNAPATMISNYAVGRTGSNLRTEVLITPHKVITRQERRNLMLVLNRIKPREAVLTIAAGLEVNIAIGLNLVSADSSYFETDILVTGASGISNAGSNNYYSQITASDSSTDQSVYYLADGVQTGARTLAFTRGQESYENYDFSSESISTIDSIEYSSISNIALPPSSRTIEGEHLIQNAYDIRFGPWTDFDLADSPDNFPGGKYGQSPFTPPALNQDGTPYQFRYASQAAYVAEQTNIIVAAGGEANATQYRLRLAQASVSAAVSDPFNCLSQNVGVSVISSWYESR
ncbi:MAG TPA: hypothetical protein VIY48_11835 [Candidatus Paceibacterota bacterium]